MTNLTIDSLNIPDEIKESLKQLSGNISINKYLPKGANGYLFFGHNKILDKKVAVKCYYWGGDKAFHAEPKQLASIRSENVIEIFHAEMIGNEWAYFITPYCPKGDLDTLLSKEQIGLCESVNILLQVLNGLSHLHGLSLVHRDLKPQNIFFTDDRNAVIGDFGSVKKVPKSHGVVPGSGHSILYRPPESITLKEYGYSGDIYQLGIVLYQILGGYLPYEPVAWLNRRTRNKYNKISDPVEKDLYVTEIIKDKIVKGKLLDLSSLPAWVPSLLKRAISKATRVDSSKRFESESAFMAKLHSMKPCVPDWCVLDGYLTLKDKISYRLCETKNNSYIVQKKVKSGWRKDNSFPENSFNNQITSIENRI